MNSVRQVLVAFVLAAGALTSISAQPAADAVRLIPVEGEAAKYWSRWRGPSGQGHVSGTNYTVAVANSVTDTATIIDGRTADQRVSRPNTQRCRRTSVSYNDTSDMGCFSISSWALAIWASTCR